MFEHMPTSLNKTQGEDGKDREGNKRSIVAALATASAMGLAALPQEAEARYVEYTSANTPELQQKVEELRHAGIPGITIVTNQGMLGGNVVINKDGKMIASSGEIMDKVLSKITPERIRFEIAESTQPRPDKFESIQGTEINISGYAQAVMERMKMSYSTGALYLNGKMVISLANANDVAAGTPGAVFNERIDLYGAGLEDKLLACVKDKVKMNMYFITGAGERVTIAEGNFRDVRKYCQ